MKGQFYGAIVAMLIAVVGLLVLIINTYPYTVMPWMLAVFFFMVFVVMWGSLSFVVIALRHRFQRKSVKSVFQSSFLYMFLLSSVIMFTLLLRHFV